MGAIIKPVTAVFTVAAQVLLLNMNQICSEINELRLNELK